MASVCIICHEEKSGAAVADTTLIRLIRSIKARFNMAAHNVLVVCDGCRAAHEQKRKNFERKWLTHLILAVLLVVIAVVSLAMSGSLNLIGLFMMLLLATMIAALALLDYMPPLARHAGEMPKIPEGVPQPPAVPNPMPLAAASPSKPKPMSKPKSKSTSQSKPPKRRR